MNRQNPRIQFTMEEEKEGSLPFMDVQFTRQSNGALARSVYRKPTHTNRYLHYQSHHLKSAKSGIVANLTDRAIKICNSEDARNAEFGKIRELLTMNGYPKKFIEKEISQQIKRSAIPQIMIKEDECKMETVSIPFIDDGLSHEIRRIARTVGIRCAFAAPNTLKPLYAVKDRLPKEAKMHAVYSIKCKSCGGEYVGETLRQVGVRKKEHMDPVRMGQ